MGGIIYCAENMTNGKCYIGQTVGTLNKRISNHNNDNNNSHFHRALKKYVDWNWYIVQEYEVNDDIKTVLNKAEIHYIKAYDSYNSGYNNSTSGGSSCYIYTDEAKAKISKAYKCRKHSQEYKNACRDRMIGKESNMKGKQHSKEAKQLNREKHLGKKWSDEQRKLFKKSMAGYVYSTITCPHCGKTGGSNTMKRWHFDNCKTKGGTPRR